MLMTESFAESSSQSCASAVTQALTPQRRLRRNRHATRKSRSVWTYVREEVELVVRLQFEEKIGIVADAVEHRRDLFGWNLLDGEVSCCIVFPPKTE